MPSCNSGDLEGELGWQELLCSNRIPEIIDAFRVRIIVNC